MVKCYRSFSHTRQWMIEQVHEKATNAACESHITLQLYHIGHVTSLLFSIVFRAVRIIWCHEHHCDFTISPPIRTALPIDVAFLEIYVSII